MPLERHHTLPHLGGKLELLDLGEDARAATPRHTLFFPARAMAPIVPALRWLPIENSSATAMPVHASRPAGYVCGVLFLSCIFLPLFMRCYL
jgi:hypothetical protein